MQKQVVELNGEAVGALIREDNGFRFLAVRYGVWSLDGRLFSNPSEAKHAVKALLAKPAGRSMPSASFWVPGDGDPSSSQFRWNAVSPIRSRHNESRA
ncbi:hypothetical protein ASD36_25535 [Rhizobium sp. Root1334]|uniref:hypothetical protein n=1 Tax=unclassified Rhizobium TaxID=2613769 RepID=UPI000728F03C|nr:MULTISPECIES: hypothetical protein [unclassified Rhizobium]KQY14964.1 hypothetical protein ASD36_25535 [Rhizobium sp. Root1334]